jgi:hypothetical protein
MGMGVLYKCTKCKYSKSLFIGWGLACKGNLVPALVKSEKEVFGVDVDEPIIDKENIILYSNLALNKKPFYKFFLGYLEWGPIMLPRKYNLCPKCGKHTLSCKDSGMLWD